MSLTRTLSEIRNAMAKEDIYAKAEKLTSFYELAICLKKCQSPQEVLEYLITEIETKNRLSYIRRIYGYYHKILPIFQMEELWAWAKDRS